jgi:hypothetical protein
MYTVELTFSDPAREDEWNAWYETYLAQLVLLPGLSTAQRFRAVTPGAQPWEYLALYSIASLDVFENEAYRHMGGYPALVVHHAAPSLAELIRWSLQDITPAHQAQAQTLPRTQTLCGPDPKAPLCPM